MKEIELLVTNPHVQMLVSFAMKCCWMPLSDDATSALPCESMTNAEQAGRPRQAGTHRNIADIGIRLVDSGSFSSSGLLYIYLLACIRQYFGFRFLLLRNRFRSLQQCPFYMASERSSV